MTGKEKDAIETMQHWIDYEKTNKEKINKADELIEIQETVLNLIQTQQEEINDLKWKNEIYVKSIKSHKSEIEKKDNIVRSIISRLDNDIKNIAETKAKKSEHYLDDYTRCRLKAYKTKTREIKEYIEKEYFAVEKENKDDN